MPLNPGDAAPDFELMDETMEKVKLSDLKGSRVVLLFYPMDFSPVCTDEHCSFGPAKADLFGDAKVFGVSTDHPFSHKAFREHYKIDYPLLADPTRGDRQGVRLVRRGRAVQLRQAGDGGDRFGREDREVGGGRDGRGPLDRPGEAVTLRRQERAAAAPAAAFFLRGR